LKKVLIILLIAVLTIFPIAISAYGAPVYDTSERGVEKQATVSLHRGYTVEYDDAVPLEDYADSGDELTDGMFAPVIDYRNTSWIGSNGWVDKMVFGQGEGGKMKRGFELVDVVGNIVEKPESYHDVRGLVVNDYQKELEEKWVKGLRRKYKVKVYPEVLKTVNNHN
jgi:hypothetical protein